MQSQTSIKFKKAFTMAEAILVMTILGIIATIMITTLKPAEFKDKGLQVLAKKVLSEIDTATTQILINDTRLGKFNQIVTTSGVTTFATNAVNTLGFYKKYLTTIRGTVSTPACCINGGASLGANAVFLKDGACMGIKATTSYNNTTGYNTIFPGETSAAKTPSITQGLIIFDTNGVEEPNTLGKDCFILPVGDDGIIYN